MSPAAITYDMPRESPIQPIDHHIMQAREHKKRTASQRTSLGRRHRCQQANGSLRPINPPIGSVLPLHGSLSVFCLGFHRQESSKGHLDACKCTPLTLATWASHPSDWNWAPPLNPSCPQKGDLKNLALATRDIEAVENCPKGQRWHRRAGST